MQKQNEISETTIAENNLKIEAIVKFVTFQCLMEGLNIRQIKDLSSGY